MTDLRAAAQQALEALGKTMNAWGGTCAWHGDVKQAITALRAALEQQAEPVKERDDAPRSVFVVVDETGTPGYCASYAQACHEHINDAIEHDINAAGWVVREYVLAQQAERKALLEALAALGIRPQQNHAGRWISKHRPGLSYPSAKAAAIDAAKGGSNG